MQNKNELIVMGEKFAWPFQIGVTAVAVVVVWLLLGNASVLVATAGGACGICLAYLEYRARRRGVTQTAVAFARTGLLEGKAATVIRTSDKVTLCVTDPDADPDDEGSGYMTDSEGY